MKDRTRATWLLPVVAAIALSACGGGDGDDASAATKAPTTAVTAAPQNTEPTTTTECQPGQERGVDEDFEFCTTAGTWKSVPQTRSTTTEPSTTTASTYAPTTTAAPPTTAASEVAPQPATPRGVFAGDANPNLLGGEPGTVSVIQSYTGPHFGQGTVLVVVRNMTDDTISRLDVTGTARAGGQVVGSGHSQLSFSPAVVQPGEVAFGYVYFDTEVPADAEYQFQVASEPFDPDGFYNVVNVQVTEFNVVPGRSHQAVVGSLANQTADTVSGPIRVDVFCFDGDQYVQNFSDYADLDELPAGATASFSVDLYEDCPSFLVAASGHDEG